MKGFFHFIIIAMALLTCFLTGSAAKKGMVDLDHATMVKMTGVSSKGYFVKAWAVAKNADQAMAQARIDAVLAALRSGIEAESGSGGTTSLPALMTAKEFDEHRAEIVNNLSNGTFLNYVKDVSSTYPKGSDNIQTANGRKVGLSMVLDYSGLRKSLQDLGWIKGLNDHFEYKAD